MPLFELQKLTKNFGGLMAVNKLDLSVEKGEIVGLIGPNGAGKTTVFNLISGVLHPSSGRILFKGENITGLSPHAIVKRGLARTFQMTTLFGEFTALDNIMVGLHLHVGIKAKVEQYKRAIDISRFMGLDAKQCEMAANLPHGYQKALDMAIALAADPELLLLDEPVTGMNALEIKAMMDKITEARSRGITILLVEHHMKVVMDICQRIYVISFGKKIAEGTPTEVSKNRDVIEAYLGSKYAAGS